MEDDPALGPLLCASLEDAGHDTALFGDATTAIAYLEHTHVDLVITDITVRKEGRPVPDGGIRLITKAKMIGRERSRVIPIIAISGAYVWQGMEFVLQTASSVGADETLKKPFEPEALVNLVDRFCATPPPESHP